MNKDKISVIIPTYERSNKEDSIKILKNSLESVYSQTYNNIEIIVVIDNKSEILTQFLQIEKESKQNLFFYEFGSKVGAATTRNFGISKSTGKWIALLDDDDVWKNDKLQKQKAQANRTPDNIILTSLFYKHRVIPNKLYTPNIPISEYLMARVWGKHIGTVQTSTIFCKKDIFIEIPFSDKLQKHQDWDWIIRATQKYNITYMKEPLSIYSTNVNNRMSSKRPWRISLKWLKSIEYLITDKAKSTFILETIILGIIEDNTLSYKEKIKNIREQYSRISFRNKLLLGNIYLLVKNFIFFMKTKY